MSLSKIVWQRRGLVQATNITLYCNTSVKVMQQQRRLALQILPTLSTVVEQGMANWHLLYSTRLISTKHAVKVCAPAAPWRHDVGVRPSATLEIFSIEALHQ